MHVETTPLHAERKYLSIAASLREELTSPSREGGRFLASERELTQRFGVDRSTVRRALDLLEEESLIRRSPGRRAELLRPRHEFGAFQPRIACVINASPRGWATVPLLHGAESVFTEREFDLTYHGTFASDPRQSEHLERERLEMCLARRVAGVLLWPASHAGNRAILQRLLDAGIPVVVVDQQITAPPLDYVGIDHVAAAYTVTQHLIRAGHRSIAHITRSNRMPSTLQRIEGYQRALRDHGLPAPPELICRCAPGAEEEQAVDRLLRSAARPTALFGINDMTALRLLHALQKRGLRVPDDLALAGIDGLPVVEYAAVPLTTLHQPFEELGRTAAALLSERIAGTRKASPRSVVLPTRLVVRRSCGYQSADCAVS